MKILCPNCRTEVLLGTIYCTECGTRLDPSAGIITQSLHPNQGDKLDGPAVVGEVTHPAKLQLDEFVVVLQILDSDRVVTLTGKKEYILGRTSEQQEVIPDVDLSEHRAFDLGVSRLHALIRMEADNSIVLMDLGSSNGTWLNSEKLVPHHPEKLGSGDIVTLGKLKIRTIIRI